MVSALPTPIDADPSNAGPTVTKTDTAKPVKDLDTTSETALNLNDLRKCIPASCFEKSLPKSLFYMFFDYAMWYGSLFAFSSLVNSSTWATLPFLVKALACVVYWNVAGFFMWGIFVVGHDCGHTTFSENQLLNDVLGHVMHASILVPYFPWQLSHRRHHMYHNHVDKDYSYAWITEDNVHEYPNVSKMLHGNKPVAFVTPFFGWFAYLAGMGDGCHFLPLPFQRMWKDTPMEDYIKCLVSAVTVAISFYVQLQLYGSLGTMALYYLGPLVMFAWWLVTVTYLQHHNESSVVYDDLDWNFTNAAFETVDRKFGYGIDNLHHNITDGHLVHHLFFTQIPHYHLLTATEAVKKHLKERNLLHKYRFEETYDFPARVHTYLLTHGFNARMARSLKSKTN